MELLTIDVETTMNASEKMGKAHPMYPENRIVATGIKRNNDPAITFTTLIPRLGPVNIDFLVGCNLSFDLSYIYKDPMCTNKANLQSQRLWDIQLAEYLLSGQQNKWPSLDEMATKYGLPLKDSKVSEYFDKGLGAEHVPKELLDLYLRHDLEVTEAIALKQITEATQTKQLDLIISQMEALHCTTEMMFNGLCIDYDYLVKYASEVATEYADLKIKIEHDVQHFVNDWKFCPVEDVDSSLQWSKFLFGGTIKEHGSEIVGVYKNGKPKSKKTTTEKFLAGVCDVSPQADWLSEKTGRVSVDDKTLEVLKKETKIPSLRELLETLHSYRELAKQLSTYIQGLSKHVMKKPDGRHFIHGKLNQVATATGRLSSTSPNLQNISSNPIKRAFISRWGKEGSLVEFDFSQLEVAILAHVTTDLQLIDDISKGRDIHSELFNQMYMRFPSKEERKWFKRLTFGLIYGAGAKTLAENAGCNVDVAKEFIRTFYNRYPGVQLWNINIERRSREESKYLDGETIKTWKLKTETGRLYVFKEYLSKFSSTKTHTFSPTELKNYPIQGLATGDIVPMMLGILFRKLVGREDVKLVNTVHDSILLDVKDSVLSTVIKEVKQTLNNTHKYFEATFGKPLALKLTAGVQVGKNWFDMEEIK